MLGVTFCHWIFLFSRSKASDANIAITANVVYLCKPQTAASFVLYVMISAISNSIKILNMFVTFYSFSSIRLNSHLRFFRRELLRELFRPHNRNKWLHNTLLNFSVHAIVEKISGVNALI